MRLVCRPKKWILVPEEGRSYSVDFDLHVLGQGADVDPRYEMMCECLDSDIQSAEGSGADYLRWLEKVQSGESDIAKLDGNAWVAHVARDKVWFEGLYSQGEGGEVTFNQFKLAVETYVRYLFDPQHRPVEVDFPTNRMKELGSADISGTRMESEQRWWYRKEGGETRGPVSTSEMRQFLSDGIVNRSTAVKGRSDFSWRALNKVPELWLATQVASIGADTRLASAWRRYVARAIDMGLIGLPFTLAMAYLPSGGSLYRPDLTLLFDYLKFSAVMILPMAMGIEAVIFGCTGTTPGKSMLGIKVLTAEATRPSFAQYLKRQVRVLVRGLALGIPFATLIAMIRQRGEVTTNGSAEYDRGRFWVTAEIERLSHARIALAAVTLACLHAPQYQRVLLMVKHAMT